MSINNIYWKLCLNIDCWSPRFQLIRDLCLIKKGGFSRIERGTCNPMFISASFKTARTWKQSRCPLADERIRKLWYISVQFSSVAQSCLTLCDPMNLSTSGLPVHHHLPEFTQTHVHQVSDAIQPSHPLSSPSPPAPNPSQHQSLFQWVNSSHEVAKVLGFQL